MLVLQGSSGLLLILFQQKHTGSLYRLIETSRHHLEPWLPWIGKIRSPQDVEQYITRSLLAYSAGRQVHFGIWHNSLLAGSVTVERLDFDHRSAELGYWLGTPHTGNGWMVHSVSRVIQYLFDDQQLNRVEIRCETGNTASAQVARRIGFQWEGTMRQAVRKGGGFADIHIFGLLRSQWNPARLNQKQSTGPQKRLTAPFIHGRRDSPV
ncbi:GNAT family N-acetyltransferase [Desmospora profundinema]|uniref:Ribosomal-protein-serine acetyltransferase n=1 Tax=Desmospora profundinema TaxID=1571184 RepID=A0ABU1IU62_9BACL|nr:GNAT family protein [Desmospora profundinema]MDR6227459.1 ribosomal-protein-serine acetyltransferase [Desmospora profundinema]